MKKLLFLSILFSNIIFFSSCDELNSFEVKPINLPNPDETNLTLAAPFKWRVEKETANLFVQNNTKVLSSSCDGLQLRDIKTGKLEWAWEDLEFHNCNSLVMEKQSYIQDNLLLFSNAGRYYCVDLLTGSTHWKKETLTDDGTDVKDFSMTGIEDLYFQIATIELDNKKKDVIRMGNIHTAESSKILDIPDFLQDEVALLVGGKRGGIWDIEASLKSNGNILLTISFGELQEDAKTKEWFFQTAFRTWNVTQKKWEYNEVKLWKNGIYLQSFFGKTKRIADRLYIYSEKQLSCYDISTTDLIWTKIAEGEEKLMLRFSETNILINFSNSKYELLDAQTGEVKWLKRFPGVAFSDVAISNHYVFVLLNKLNIYSISEGTVLKSINQPYDNSNSFKDYFPYGSTVKVVEKEKGKIQLVLSTEDYMFGASYGEE